MPIKFFQKDVISGLANKPGDKFSAAFMGQRVLFVVIEINRSCIFAEFA